MRFLQPLIISRTFHKGETTDLWSEQVNAAGCARQCSTSAPLTLVRAQKPQTFVSLNHRPLTLFTYGSSPQRAEWASSSNTLCADIGSGQ